MTSISSVTSTRTDRTNDTVVRRSSIGHGSYASRLLPSRRAVVWSLVVLGLLSLLVLVANNLVLTVDQPLSDLARVGGLTGFAGSLSLIGSTDVAVIVALGLATWAWRRCRASSIAIPITIAAGALLNVVLKTAIGRARPPDPATGVALASFPSGHAFQATLVLGLVPLALFVATGRPELVRWTRLAAGLGIAAVAASRVMLGAHWPTDVIAGVLVGVALLEVTHLALARHHRTTTDCGCPLSVVAPA
jgi:membrane-associated phospholipid phosphatase